MAFVYRMTAILIFSVAWCCNACEVNDVAVYKVKLHMKWNEEIFPKEYPGKVQWSQVFGQSHNASYALYRVGEILKPSVRNFMQFGTVDSLMEEGQEEPKVYDQFTAPPVEYGMGDTEAIVFVDAEHSSVSLISKMLPSELLFIGVDSLDLCLHSSWVDQLILDLDPLNAGVDEHNHNAKHVEKLHPTIQTYGKFGYYNHNPSQAYSIAQVEFQKTKEYSTKELNDIVRKEFFTKSRTKDIPDNYEAFNYKQEFTTKNSLEQLKDLEEDPVGIPKPNNPMNNVVLVTKAPVFNNPDDTLPSELENMDDVVLAVANGKNLGLGKHLPRHFRSRLHHAVNRTRGKDCIVSAWSEWTPCDDPCGEKSRVKTVVQRKKGDGKDCPDLVQKQRCGHCMRGDGDYLW